MPQRSFLLMTPFVVDGQLVEAKLNERLADYLIRAKAKVPHVCYHDQLGPIQTCDTCMVEVDGELVRSCATTITAGMKVETKSARAESAQKRAYDHILANHLLYCTVCDNNNGNCTVHNGVDMLELQHQHSPLSRSPTRWMSRIPSTATTPTSVFCADVASRPAKT